MKVLDAGSGNTPIPQATVLLDKHPTDNTHRRGALKTVKGAKFVQGDIQNLTMFEEDEFDFVNCTHVLEHCERPWIAFLELMRVGKSGYVEVPSFIAERLLLGSPNHKWTIVSFFNISVFLRSRGRPYQTSRMKFKFARLFDFLFNTAHTKMFWGHGKVIKHRFNNQSTGSLVRKIENFLSMTVGVSTQYAINMLIFTLKWKRGRWVM